MRLYLVRHGKAGMAANDFQRELTDEGVKTTRKAATLLAAAAVRPAAIYSSPRRRARQTADIIAQALGATVEEHEAVNFGFSPAALQALIREVGAAEEMMFVGHNPSMSATVTALTGAAVDMRVSGIARIDVREFEPLAGELVWLMAPRIYRAAVDDE